MNKLYHIIFIKERLTNPAWNKKNTLIETEIEAKTATEAAKKFLIVNSIKFRWITKRRMGDGFAPIAVFPFIYKDGIKQKSGRILEFLIF